jgi:hypothetical protein
MPEDMVIRVVKNSSTLNAISDINKEIINNYLGLKIKMVSTFLKKFMNCKHYLKISEL